MKKLIILLILMPVLAQAQYGEVDKENAVTVAGELGSMFQKNAYDVQIIQIDTGLHQINVIGKQHKEVIEKVPTFSMKFGYRIFNNVHFNIEPVVLLGGGLFLNANAGYNLKLSDQFSIRGYAGACLNHFNWHAAAQIKWKAFYIQYQQIGKTKGMQAGFTGDLFSL